MDKFLVEIYNTRVPDLAHLSNYTMVLQCIKSQIAYTKRFGKKLSYIILCIIPGFFSLPSCRSFVSSGVTVLFRYMFQRKVNLSLFEMSRNR